MERDGGSVTGRSLSPVRRFNLTVFGDLQLHFVSRSVTVAGVSGDFANRLMAVWEQVTEGRRPTWDDPVDPDETLALTVTVMWQPDELLAVGWRPDAASRDRIDELLRSASVPPSEPEGDDRLGGLGGDQVGDDDGVGDGGQGGEGGDAAGGYGAGTRDEAADEEADG